MAGLLMLNWAMQKGEQGPFWMKTQWRGWWGPRRGFRGRLHPGGPSLQDSSHPHLATPGRPVGPRDAQAQTTLEAAWDRVMVSVACWLLEDGERPEPRW